MPLFHPVATSASMTGNDITVLCSLPDNRNGGEVQVRLSGDLGAWTSPDANGAYSNSSITDTFLALPAGTWDVRVVTGDGEASNTLAGEIVIEPTTPGPTTTSEPVAVSTLRYMTLRIEKWFWKGF